MRAPPDAKFSVEACRNRTIGCDFYPVVPIGECERYCGSSYGPYNLSDVFSALITWVLPLFTLLANMNLSESTLKEPKCASEVLKRWPLRWLWGIIGSQLPKLFVCSVQLANPIGAIWSLTAKLRLGQQLWTNCQDRFSGLGDHAARDIAHVCYCLDDFGHHLFRKRVDRLLALLGNESLIIQDQREPTDLGLSQPVLRTKRVQERVYEIIEETSRDLALIRVRNVRHTGFAVLVYVGSAVASLLSSTNSAGLDYALPHTVALRELCFFILAQLILSSAAGGWPQQWTAQFIIQKFALQIHITEKSLLSGDEKLELWTDLAKAPLELWNGGSYVFRPEKDTGLSNERDDQRYLAMAFVMVIVAFAVSFTMSSLTPTTGIGGRGLAEISYIIVWIANFTCEELWIVPRFVSRRELLFVLIWIKDGFISLLVLLCFFLPFIGQKTNAGLNLVPANPLPRLV